MAEEINDSSLLLNYSTTIREFVVSSCLLQQWPEYHALLISKMEKEKPWTLTLPMIACAAVGGEIQPAVPVSAGWYAMRLAAHLLNSIEDRKSLEKEGFCAPSQALNYSIGLIFNIFHFLETIPPIPVGQQPTALFALAGYTSAHGQDLCLTGRRTTEGETLDQRLDAYWYASIQKSGSIYQAGLAGGAAVGAAAPQQVEALGNYGLALGVILQILDDCRDVFQGADLLECEISLPVLLYSITLQSGSGGQKIILPSSRADLLEVGLPAMISGIIDSWRQRALSNLQLLSPSRYRTLLENILDQNILGFESSP